MMTSAGSKRPQSGGSNSSSGGNSSSSTGTGSGTDDGNRSGTGKRPRMDFDFDSKFIASSQDDLDIGLLLNQNRRLAERLFQRQRIETELRQRIEQMEKKQLNDNVKLYVINRYWNQLNDDMRIIMEPFDNIANESSSGGTGNGTGSEVPDEDSTDDPGIDSSNLSAETASFVRQLANVDKEELDEQLQQRVLLSTRVVSKVLTAFERIVQRNEKVMMAIKESTMDEPDNDEENTIRSPDDESSPASPSPLFNDRPKRKSGRKLDLDETVAHMNEELTKENKNLHQMVTSLHEKYRTANLKYNQLTDKLDSRDLQLDELKNRIDELEFELNKSRTREQRLEDHLYEAREKLRDLQQPSSGGSGTPATNTAAATSSQAKNPEQSGGQVSSTKMEILKRELEEQRELASSRLTELEQLNNRHKEALKNLQKAQMDLKFVPNTVIRESAEYKSLQSNYSVLYNDSVQIRTQLEDIRQQLAATKTVHLRQIEQMEAEELAMQKQIRDSYIQREDAFVTLRKKYEMERLEFQQSLAVNEQTGPINREMRNLITSLQNHTSQLKSENTRNKKKLKDCTMEIARLRQIIVKNGLKVCCGGILLPGQKPALDNGVAAICTIECCNTTNASTASVRNDVVGIKTEPLQIASDSSNEATTTTVITTKSEDLSSTGGCTPDGAPPLSIKEEIKTDPMRSESTTPPLPSGGKRQSPGVDFGIQEQASGVDFGIGEDQKPQQQQPGSLTSTKMVTNRPQPPVTGTPPQHRFKSDDVRELKAQLKKSWETQRELKILLETYKSVDREKREKAHLMAIEKKLRHEVEELRHQNRKLVEERRGPGASGSESRRFSASSRAMSDDDAKKLTKYEEIIKELQKNVSIHAQQEQAMLSEMEVTGQAFEDMQDQNSRLILQLQEKDEANFKLISDRIKSEQIQKILKDEKDLLTEQILGLQHQIETQNQVVRKLEEKERALQASLATAEKQMAIRQQTLDYWKRKAVESSQSAADLKLHLDKYSAQVKDAQSIVADKTGAWQQETFKTKRLQEEVNLYKRKYERAKKFELAATADEVLQEEIRELREELTCPSCKTKRKDAVLNKCFHVFCYDCLKTRYESRQRKCPKCNQSFSANDFHRLYLA